MAEVIGKNWANKHNVKNWTISSAGTLNIYDSPASENAIIACREIGIDLENHLSRGLTHDLVVKQNYIFGMENAHCSITRDIVPEVSDRIFTLGNFAGIVQNSQVEDPMGLDLHEYRQTRNHLIDLVDLAFDRIYKTR